VGNPTEGSLYNGNSIEHGWKNNYLVNPFGIKAAISGISSLSSNFGLCLSEF